MSDYLDELEESEETKIPTPEDFFLKEGLYNPITLGTEYDDKVAKQILALEFFNEAIRTYCPDCKCESSFRTDLIKTSEIETYSRRNIYEQGTGISRKEYYTPEQVFSIKLGKKGDIFKDRTFTLEFYCTHNHHHRIFYTFNIKNGFIQKVGQFPSIADSLTEEVKNYKKVLEKELNKEKANEFATAIGLYSHGVGIGSFVYLRRIFEAFIFQAKDEALAKDEITIEDFNQARMVDKIELLKKFLPEVIVENKTLYGVVSKGVHELSDSECKDYFDIVKMGIELILDEKIAKRKAQEKKDKFAKDLSKAHQEIVSKG
ncbi:hypothetical protein N5S71_08980 [Aliarcobacter cryaerophilus]|uniref:hypothetical protein n=1 Tax=Aliarcobacter cryaerophilus TaxID=28198 RepID=UPI0021B51456|nr:hypothetical protein [Aliarcobacter cryaerophilus]MCT7462646.1 hypothetical protein [Aliarcobacter cryaerophilus]